MLNEIKSDKISVNKIFSEMCFIVPEYQRPYVWGSDQINNLLEDIAVAMQQTPDSEYFLGSFVCHNNKEKKENNLLDGQQRITTLFLVLSVIGDIAKAEKARINCRNFLYQEADEFRKLPACSRLTYKIRPEVESFVESIGRSGTNEGIKYRKSNDISIKNIINADSCIRDFFSKNKKEISPESFLTFLLNNVVLIYIATTDFDDAFRLFTILNDRGVRLSNGDILKAINLGSIPIKHEKDKEKYAKLWQDAENELGDDFELFLSHIRTILVKDKARLSLLQEYEKKIYGAGLLAKGEATFEFIEKYLGYYANIIRRGGYDFKKNFEFYNLIKVMSLGFTSKDWIPPLLRYYDKFEEAGLYEFLVALDNKFSFDWISRKTPTERIESMNDVIKSIDSSHKFDEVISSNCLTISKTNLKDLKEILEDDIYGYGFTKYILLKMDYLYHNHDQRMNFETISVEHILPRTPKEKSQWLKDFSEEDLEGLVDKLGNLVLITRRKNSSQSNLDYKDKKEKYFTNNIDTCANSLRILNTYNKWTPEELNKNQEISIKDLLDHYKRATPNRKAA